MGFGLDCHKLLVRSVPAFGVLNPLIRAFVDGTVEGREETDF